jgi:hypothetical protein
MTLLIGTISDKQAVITADGLSRVNPVTGAGVGSDRVQKIFPVPEQAIAFVHHGLNILAGKPVSEFIAEYIDAHATMLGTAEVEDIAKDLSCYAEQAAQKALSDRTNKGVVGFWIVGFSAGRAKPELYEVCWPTDPAPRRHEGIVLGGDGQQFIKVYLSQPLASFSPSRVTSYSATSARQYHQALYKKAEAKQNKAGQVIFGGHQHQLMIEKNAWKWTKAPMEDANKAAAH